MLLASRDFVESTDEAWYWLAGISGVLFLGILIALIYFAYKYHRSRHPKSADIHGHLGIEIAWVVIPTIISVFMFYKGYEGFLMMRSPPADAYEIDVEARQWSWTFTYPEGGVTSTELYVPVDRPIKLNLTSPDDDVLHSLYIPAYRIKEDCVPGRPAYMWFEADKIETHHIFCAEFCGKDHAKMLSKLHVLSLEDYNAWLDQKIADRFKPIDESVCDPNSPGILACDAPSLYATYCASCHGANGQGGLVEGARDFRVLDDKWKQGSGVADIFATLTTGVKDTQMRAFTNLSAWDRFALAHHVAGFSKDQRDKGMEEKEVQALIKRFKLDEMPKVRRVFPIDKAIKDLSVGKKKDEDEKKEGG